MSCGIYKITNLINGHIYIGQSIDIERRWYNHKHRHIHSKNSPLYQAFRKYGINNFQFEIIEECDISLLNEKEIYWIRYYNSFKNGYNATIGGDGCREIEVKLTKEQTDEIIELLLSSDITQRELSKLYNVGEDTISEINHGKTHRRDNIQYPIRQNKKEHNNICPICGNKKTDNAQCCSKCRNEYYYYINRPDRETLKKLIRTQSFVSIGKQYNVTDNAIKKWCKTYKLPYKRKDIKLYTTEEWDKI